MTDLSRIVFNLDTGEVIATLTEVTFRNFVGLFNTEVLMLQGAEDRMPDGRRTYRFTMPDDERRVILMRFLEQAEFMMRIQPSLN